MNGETAKSIIAYLDLLTIAFGFISCLMGFGESIYAGWTSSSFVNEISDLLLGIALIALGNGLATFNNR